MFEGRFAAVGHLLFLLALGASLSAQTFEINKDQLLRDLKILSADDMQGRKVETPANAKARAFIMERFNQTGIQKYKDTYEQPFTFTYRKDKSKAEHQGVNVVGLIKGADSENTIVVTAHYDHLGIKNDQIYNGADDNASGVAALFAIGSYFSKNPPHNSIMIAALDGEEADAESGGRKLVQQLDRKTTVMNVNLDMIGRDRNHILYAVGTYHYPYLKPYLEKVAGKSPVKLLFGHDQPKIKHVEDWTKESDHYAFHVQRIPFIYFGVEDYEHHHKPTDEFENMTHEFYVNAVETILIALKEFDENLAEIQRMRAP